MLFFLVLFQGCFFCFICSLCFVLFFSAAFILNGIQRHDEQSFPRPFHPRLLASLLVCDNAFYLRLSTRVFVSSCRNTEEYSGSSVVLPNSWSEWGENQGFEFHFVLPFKTILPTDDIWISSKQKYAKDVQNKEMFRTHHQIQKLKDCHFKMKM